MRERKAAMEDRQPRLSRVVLAYRPENFDCAVADFSRALGLRFEMLDTAHLGLRVAMAFSAGVELICPDGEHGHGAAVRAAIETQGEGLQQIILAVPDLEEGAERARLAGWDSGGFRIDCFDANPAWREDYASMREAPLPPIAQASVTLIELVPHG